MKDQKPFSIDVKYIFEYYNIPVVFYTTDSIKIEGYRVFEFIHFWGNEWVIRSYVPPTRAAPRYPEKSIISMFEMVYDRQNL